MEIDAKIKAARNEAGLTQEQVAEALGVSRQTISNWENGKSYPDIISVIKMSDLYSVSLDHLLKEKTEMKQSYIDYLEESTNTVKSREKLAKLILILVTLAIWAVAVAVFWLLIDGSDAMAYSLVFLWGILPVTILTVSFITGKRGYFGKLKWIMPAVFGIMYMFSGYVTFDTANMVEFKTVRWPDFGMFPAGLAISLAGMLLGILAAYIKTKKDEKKQTASCGSNE